MHRRDYLALTAAFGGLGGLPSGAVATPASTTGTVSGGCTEGIQRTDWVPHYTVEIEKEGVATVEITVEGTEIPRDIGLGTGSSDQYTTLQGEDALEEREWGLLWTPAINDTVTHEVPLGNYRAGNVVAEVSDDAVFTVVNELVAPTGWAGGVDALPEVHRFTINPPDGWTAAFSGDEVGTNTYEVNPRLPLDQYPRELIAVGDFDVRTREVSGTGIRGVSLPSADGVDVEDALDLWADALPHFEYYYQDAAFPKLGVIVPTPEGRRGGQAREHSFVVTDNLPLMERGTRTLSTVAAELGRTFQRHDQPRWYLDGTNNWINQLLVLYEADRISEDELREHLQIAATEGGKYVGEPYETRLDEIEDARWMALPMLAALDMDVRARTNGEADYSDLLARTQDPRGCDSYTVEREALLTALVDITGVAYVEFFERFIDGWDYPEVVLSEAFSVSNPRTVDFGPALKYASVDLSPEQPGVGEPMTVTGRLENVGSAEWESTVEFRVDGTAVGTRDVELAAGQAEIVTFEHIFEAPGPSVLALDRCPVGEVSVTPDTTPTETAASPTATATEGPTPTATESPVQPGLGVLQALGGLGGLTVLLFGRRSGADDG